MKGAARLVALVGAALVGWLLFRASPRDVTLVYAVGPTEAPSLLEVRIAHGGDVLRTAEFRLPAGGGQVQHTVHLPDGRYQLAFRISSDVAGRAAPAPTQGERDVDVAESGTIVLPLGP